MKTRRSRCLGGRFTPLSWTIALVLATAGSFAQGQAKKKNPASKLYVADVGGIALIDTGDALEDLTKRSVYTAQGTIIETKKADGNNPTEKNFSTMVYSN